jgi:hypothetical protein
MTSGLAVLVLSAPRQPQELAALGTIPSPRDKRFPGTQQAETIF